MTSSYPPSRCPLALQPLSTLLPVAAVLGPALLGMSLLASAATPAFAQDETEDRRVVAVLRFDNNTGDAQYDHLGRALSSMTISDLSVIERIQLVERERLEELIAELDLQQSAYVDRESAQSVGMIIGAEYVVAGAFVTVEPEMRLDTRIDRVETAEIVTTAEVTGHRESLFDLQQRLANQLVEGFELVLTEEERERLRAQQEANRIDDLETFVAFSQALCLLDYGEVGAAFEAIQSVQTAAPGSQIVRATMNSLRDRAEDEARTRLEDEARSRLGGLLGRSRAPERRTPATAC
jgi:TolB-like protein